MPQTVSNFKILSYNVCGLRAKVGEDYFFHLLNKYDLILLLETFISEHDEEFIVKSLPNFKIDFFSFAERNANFGRAIGGIICCVNLQSSFTKEVSFVCKRNIKLIEIKNWLVLPIYLNYNKWENSFENLCNFINSNSEQNLIIIGDFNGRISNEQNNSDMYNYINVTSTIRGVRKSKDRILNTRGRKLLELFLNFGLVVLNGRTQSDAEGEFTFIGKMGNSVIDLAVVSVSCLEIVNDFEVISHAGSDHLPICVNCKVGRLAESQRGGDCILPLLPRIKWTNSDNVLFGKNIDKEMSTFDVLNDNQINVNSMIRCIKQAAHLNRVQIITLR